MSGPCIVQYLYVHDAGEAYSYPTGRTQAGPARLAERYLECALVQAASLRRGSVDGALVINPEADERLGPRGRRLLDAIAAEGTAIVHAPYAHAPDAAVTAFAASRYVLDAIAAVAGAAPAGRRFWFADVDCVWLDPATALRAAEAAGGVGFLPIGYAPDWPVSGVTRTEIGAIGARLGTCEPLPAWVGGEALAGTAAELLGLLAACDAVDASLERAEVELATEEQLLTLVGGLGEVRLGDLSGIVGRIWTGPRHGAANPSRPEVLAVWHLPSEKGLSFRRAAAELLAGRRGALDRDLGDPRRALRRFNVAGAGPARRVRDDGWLVLNRARDRVRALRP